MPFQPYGCNIQSAAYSLIGQTIASNIVYHDILRESNSKSNTIQQCFVHKLDGYPINGDEDLDELFAVSQAVTGLIVDEHRITYEDYDGYRLDDKVLGEMNKKFKIYACDEEPDLSSVDEDERYSWTVFSCENNRKKCSRLIFVWSTGGRGINFLDGHGIKLNVRTMLILIYLA